MRVLWFLGADGAFKELGVTKVEVLMETDGENIKHYREKKLSDFCFKNDHTRLGIIQK